jgi:hypothetical protein
MENQIIITKERLKMAYKDADEQQKKLLENLFSKEILKEKYGDIRDRIKTYEDACSELGIKPIDTRVSNQVGDFILDDNTIAYIKLKTICKALNEGWVPQFTKTEYRYYPWFFLYTQEELNNMEDSEKKRHRIIIISNSQTKYKVFGFAYAYYTPSDTSSSVSCCLCLKNLKLSEYCGKQFIKLWLDYLM